jgi:hypothetical protein
VDFVYEQDIARLQVREQRGEVARALQHRTRSLAQVDAHFPRDDVRQRGLAQARRAEQQNVVQRLFSSLGGLDEYFQLAADFLLADVLRKRAGAQRALDLLLLRGDRPGGDEAIGFNRHGLPFEKSFVAHLIGSAPSPSIFM